MSTAYPGRASEKHASRTVVNPFTGIPERIEIQRPLVVKKYNQFMGGVDKSDQFLAYHNILRKNRPLSGYSSIECLHYLLHGEGKQRKKLLYSSVIIQEL